MPTSITDIIKGVLLSPFFYSLLILSSLYLWWLGVDTPTLVVLGTYSVFASFLIVSDMKTFIIPDVVIGLGLISGMLLIPHFTAASTLTVGFGALIGFLFFAGVRMLTTKLTGRESMGYGDVKLLAMLGAWVGSLHLAPLLLVASLLSLPFAVAMRFIRPQNPRIPFAPALLIAGYLVLLYPLWFWQKLAHLRAFILQ